MEREAPGPMNFYVLTPSGLIHTHSVFVFVFFSKKKAGGKSINEEEKGENGNIPGLVCQLNPPMNIFLQKAKREKRVKNVYIQEFNSFSMK